MAHKVPYSMLAGRYRPYLEVIFFNSLVLAKSSKTLGLIDSGADDIVIPHSMGKQIGLQEPTAPELEKPTIISGVGGEAWILERKCRIHLLNRSSNELKVFDETVSWIYPFPSTQRERQAFADRLEVLRSAKSPETNPDRLQSLDSEIERLSKDIGRIDKLLEVDTILGRVFFDNFKYISFRHHDRRREYECYVEYEVEESKVIETLPLREATST